MLFKICNNYLFYIFDFTKNSIVSEKLGSVVGETVSGWKERAISKASFNTKTRNRLRCFNLNKYQYIK